jgi:hypothetical protein
MTNPQNRFQIFLPIIILVSLFLIFFWAQFGELLILIEARDYIKYGGWFNDYASLVKDCLIPSGKNTRYVSMFGFYVMKNSCGYGAVCINTFQLVILSLAGVFLYLHSLQLFKNILMATLVAALWLFSLPALDAIAWQAVNHDKMAALFVFMTLFFSTLFVEKNGRFVILLSNVLITLFLILAYNSKESAFFLMPLILVQYALYSTSIKDFGKNLVKLIIPFIFSLYFIIGYFIKLADYWKEHTLSNDIVNTITVYSNFLLNYYAGFLSVAIVFGIIMIIPLFLIPINHFKLKKDGIENRALNRNLIYSYLFFLLSIAIVIKVKHPSVFYLLIPLAGFLLIIFSSIKLIFYHLSHRIYLKGIFIVSLTGLLIFHLYNYSTLFKADFKYAKLLQHSNQLKQTFSMIADKLPLSTEKVYNIFYPASIENSSLIKGVNPISDMAVINFIYQVDGDYPVKITTYNDVEEVNGMVKEDNAYYIILDREYYLLKIF